VRERDREREREKKIQREKVERDIPNALNVCTVLHVKPVFILIFSFAQAKHIFLSNTNFKTK
jgi:hypothetical protein